MIARRWECQVRKARAVGGGISIVKFPFKRRVSVKAFTDLCTFRYCVRVLPVCYRSLQMDRFVRRQQRGRRRIAPFLHKSPAGLLPINVIVLSSEMVA